MSRIRLLLCAICVCCQALACSGSTPKPLPGGPPPEYEKPRAYEGNLGDAPPPKEDPEVSPPPASTEAPPPPSAPAPEPAASGPGAPKS